MRGFLLVAVMCGAAGVAQAADMPDLPFLRGSFTEGLFGRGKLGRLLPRRTRRLRHLQHEFHGLDEDRRSAPHGWPGDGAGPANIRMADHGKSFDPWRSFGGFFGYNSQWSDIVIGLELNYTHGKFGGSQTDSMSRFFTLPSGYSVSATYEGTARMNITDMGTIRARAALRVRLVPPLCVRRHSAGAGRYHPHRPVYSNQVNPAEAPDSRTSIRYQRNRRAVYHLIYGYSFGLGTEVMLISNLFLRAEWEYVRFTSSSTPASTRCAQASATNSDPAGAASIRAPLTDLPPPVALSP